MVKGIPQPASAVRHGVLKPPRGSGPGPCSSPPPGGISASITWGGPGPTGLMVGGAGLRMAPPLGVCAWAGGFGVRQLESLPSAPPRSLRLGAQAGLCTSLQHTGSARRPWVSVKGLCSPSVHLACLLCTWVWSHPSLGLGAGGHLRVWGRSPCTCLAWV